MSGKGNCYDNAMVEMLFKMIKPELVWRTVFYTRAEAATAIAAISTASTTSSGAIPRLTTSAPPSSNDWRHVEQMPLHFIGASSSPRSGSCRRGLVAHSLRPCQSALRGSVRAAISRTHPHHRGPRMTPAPSLPPATPDAPRLICIEVTSLRAFLKDHPGIFDLGARCVNSFRP